MSLVDVVIPTQFEPARKWSLIHQVKSALNQGRIDARVVILCSKENHMKIYDGLYAHLSDSESELTRVFISPDGIKGDPFNTPEGYMCLPAMLAYMESEPIGDWQMHAADDDCLTPWALKYLLDASDNQSMVIGRMIAVNRNFEDRSDYQLGVALKRCHVDLSAAIIRTESLRSLPTPWIGTTTGYEDWNLIHRMATHFPYRFINQIVNIKSMTL